jgi:hypothetical protein
MKKTLVWLLLLTAGLTLAQINNFTPGYSSRPPHLPYDKKIPPKIGLDAAYGKAVQALGMATNQFYCVSATCLDYLGMMGSSRGVSEYGWTFVFSNTNGSSTNVYVSFNKDSTVWVGDLKPKGF